MARKPAIVTRVVNSCWRLFKGSVVVALLCAAGIGAYMYARMDEEIRRHAEAFLAERYPTLDVSIGGARRVEGKGIVVYDLELADPQARPDADPLLAVDELVLVCDVELASLVQGAPEVRRVEVRRPRLAVRRGAGGDWNAAALLPCEPCQFPLPEVVIRDGSLSLADDAAADEPPLRVTEVDLTLKPSAQAAAPGEWPSLRIDAVLSSPQLKRAEIHAEVHGRQRRGTASLSLAKLQIDRSLLAWLRPHLPPEARGSQVSGVLDGTAEATWQDGAAAPLDGAAELQLSDGRVDDARLPRPLTELSGRIAVDAQRLRVEDLAGKCGAATVAVALHRVGWAPGAQLALSARVADAPLDEELYYALPELLRSEWDKYRPAGVVDATLQAVYDGAVWRPTAPQPGQAAATLTGRKLSFESDKFAYRLTNGSGTIHLVPGPPDEPLRLDVDLVAIGGGQPVRIVCQAFDPRPGAAGWAEISGDNLLIEPAMIEALEPKPRDVVAKLHPAGRFNIRYRIERRRPGEEPHKSLQFDLADVRVKYDEFPYRLEGIRGRIAAEDGRWSFTNLVSSGQRVVHGEGYMLPSPGGTELYLRFTGVRVPLDRALFDALREPVQEAWQRLRPGGDVDLVAEVLHRTGEEKANISVTIDARPESTQLKPTFFDYRLENVAGRIHYRDGRVSLENVRAKHDAANFSTNGGGFFAPDGGWEFRLIGLRAENIAASADLIAAMPEQLGKMIDQLQPTGVFTLHNSELAFRKPASSITAVESTWDVQLDCHQVDLHCGLDLQNIHGAVRLIGASNGVQAHSGGELSLETVSIEDVQFTEVHGPIWIDETACRLGKWASDQRPEETPRRLSAKVYGGMLAADAWVKFDARPQYGAAGDLTGADLHRLLVERFGSQQSFQGKVDANVMIGGEGPSLARLRGEGDVHIRDANIYETSLLVSLLKILRTGVNDRTTFNQSDIRFRIQGRHVTLDQIDFLGDAVNLYGQGMTDFDQRLNLVFTPSIIRRGGSFPLVGDLMRQANSQSMQMYVDGTLSDPHVTTEALPVIKQMLDQIRADLEDPLGAPVTRQAQTPSSPGVTPPR